MAGTSNIEQWWFYVNLDPRIRLEASLIGGGWVFTWSLNDELLFVIDAYRMGSTMES